MATRKTSRRHTDRHGTTAPTVTATVQCETGRHGQCKGELFSLLAAGPCQCQCHRQREGVAA
jgi:hypothetical protein